MKRILALAAIALLAANAFPLAAQQLTALPATTQPVVAFTFDDLPAHGPLAPGQARRDVITSILATLQREHMPPVYGFINGVRLAQHPYQVELLEAWHNAGQPLGNHTYSHPELDKISLAQFAHEVAANEPILRKVDPGGDWHWFRFPFLEEGETLGKREGALATLRERGYKVAEVSLNFQDYAWDDAYGLCAAKHDEAAIRYLHDSYLAASDASIHDYRDLSHQIFGRDIAYVLLLHVGSFDARMLPELIALFRARGFAFVTLPAAEADAAYSIDSKFAIRGGGTFLDLLARIHNRTPAPDPEAMDKVNALCH